MAKAKLTFKDVSALDKLSRARAVLTAVAAEPALQPTTPPLADLQLLLTQATAANTELYAIRSQARQKTVERNDLLDALCNGMMSLASFIQSASRGNAAVIMSAGLGVAGRATRIGELPAPKNIRDLLMPGFEGQIGLRWKPVKGRRVYEVEYAEMTGGELEWKSGGVCTKAKLVIKGLRSGVQYQFRVFAIGTAGRGLPSPTIALRAP